MIVAKETSHRRARQIDTVLAQSGILARVSFHYPGYVVRIADGDAERARPLIEALRRTWARHEENMRGGT